MTHAHFSAHVTGRLTGRTRTHPDTPGGRIEYRIRSTSVAMSKSDFGVVRRRGRREARGGRGVRKPGHKVNKEEGEIHRLQQEYDKV